MEAVEKPKIQFTKERFYLEHAMVHGLPSLRRHINRYKWAASCFPQGSSVLHAGCGSGYGDHILMNRASRVTAVDISSEAIHYARWKAQKVGQTKVEYINNDLRTLFLPGQKFDAAVCIEVIEHVSAEDQHKIMERIKAHLEPNGWLIITTPARKDGAPMTDFHEHEFSVEEFKKFLGFHFIVFDFDDPRRFGVPEDFLLAVCRGPIL